MTRFGNASNLELQAPVVSVNIKPSPKSPREKKEEEEDRVDESNQILTTQSLVPPTPTAGTACQNQCQ